MFLDEPTTGVDPLSRRHIWRAISQKLDSGMSIVLTSHSMEECEALCNRLVIMSNGRICCIGSAQQLKNKYGNGYTLHIKVSARYRWNSKAHQEVKCDDWNDVCGSVLQQNINKLNEFMRDAFEGCELKGIHNNLLHYFICDANVSLAYIFGTIERFKDKLNIEDYSVGQTTLEQIFLSFADKNN